MNSAGERKSCRTHLEWFVSEKKCLGADQTVKAIATAKRNYNTLFNSKDRVTCELMTSLSFKLCSDLGIRFFICFAHSLFFGIQVAVDEHRKKKRIQLVTLLKLFHILLPLLISWQLKR